MFMDEICDRKNFSDEEITTKRCKDDHQCIYTGSCPLFELVNSGIYDDDEEGSFVLNPFAVRPFIPRDIENMDTLFNSEDVSFCFYREEYSSLQDMGLNKTTAVLVAEDLEEKLLGFIVVEAIDGTYDLAIKYLKIYNTQYAEDILLEFLARLPKFCHLNGKTTMVFESSLAFEEVYKVILSRGFTGHAHNGMFSYYKHI